MSSRQAREYQHSEQHFSSYRTFENQQKDLGLRQGGFTTDDRITGLNEIAYEPSPEPEKPKPKPKKANPNLFGYHPKISKEDARNQQFMQQQQQMVGMLIESDDKASLLSNNSSVNRVNKDFGNTKNHPKYFRDRGSSINSNIKDIDEIPLKLKIIGIICITIAIASWVSLGHVLQQFQSEYNKPYFVSYCITGGLFALLIVWISIYCYDKYNSRQQFTEKAFKNETTYTKQKVLLINMQFQRKGLWKKLIIPSFIFCVLYITCNYFWVTSLEKTMVSVNATIYQSNVALIYILSIFLLNNKLTWQKNIGVVLCGVGVVTVLFGAYKQEDEDENGDIKNEVSGILECILSVVCYSLNAVLFKMTANKYFNPNKQVKDTLLLQSMTGFMGLLTLWPIMFILDSSEVEKFELPQRMDDASLVLTSMALNLSFFAAFAISVVLTNPVFTSIGTLFVIPVGYFSDIIIHSYNVELPAILGTIAIGFGFLLLNVPIFSVIKSKLKKKESY